MNQESINNQRAVLNHQGEPQKAGRVCPLDYRIPADVFSGEPLFSCDSLIVVGGLYGNAFALSAVNDLVEVEEGDVRVVFNGDIHWFDRDPEDFALIEQGVAPYVPLVGNVEFELRRQKDVGAGCGCAYPDCTSDAAVERSNQIHAILSRMVKENPQLKKLMINRASVCSVGVGEVKVAITHGDEKLIGGWGCSRESLQNEARKNEINRWMEASGVGVLATTHTCAPAALRLSAGAVINNGAAGMPNFKNRFFGLATRVSKKPSSNALYRAKVEDVYVEAVPLNYDHDSFIRWFDTVWPRTSPASISYRERIVRGPEDCPGDSLLGGFELLV